MQALRHKWAYGWAGLALVSSAVVAGLFALGLLPFVQIRENSMAPTLQPGNLVLLHRTAYLWNRIQVGDVLIFDKPAYNEQLQNFNFSEDLSNSFSANFGQNRYFFQNFTNNFRPNIREVRANGLPSKIRDESPMIKRCVLLPNMRLHWRESQLYIPARQDYVRVDENVRQSLAKFERVPEGFIFVLGDNLQYSFDSRHYGPVPLAQVRGKAIWLK